MTTKEAIEILQRVGQMGPLAPRHSQAYKACCVAISAMEKQVGRKPQITP